MTDSTDRTEEDRFCAVCGEPANRHVRVKVADGTITGWMCDEHAADLGPLVGLSLVDP